MSFDFDDDDDRDYDTTTLYLKIFLQDLTTKFFNTKYRYLLSFLSHEY